MLNNNKLDNLLYYYILFYQNQDIFPHYSYVTEKFDMFFNNNPNKIKDIIPHYKKNLKIFQLSQEYFSKWNTNVDDFINQPDFIKWYFTYYLIYSFNENKQHEYGIYYKIITIYNKFFIDYTSINNNCLKHGTHEILRKTHKNIKENNLFLYRNIFIKNLTNV